MVEGWTYLKSRRTFRSFCVCLYYGLLKIRLTCLTLREKVLTLPILYARFNFEAVIGCFLSDIQTLILYLGFSVLTLFSNVLELDSCKTPLSVFAHLGLLVRVSFTLYMSLFFTTRSTAHWHHWLYVGGDSCLWHGSDDQFADPLPGFFFWGGDAHWTTWLWPWRRSRQTGAKPLKADGWGKPTTPAPGTALH